MKNHNTNTGTEPFALLRQQRYLYHQLKMLNERQQQLNRTNSPEVLLEVISGPRKLIKKLHELNNKLSPIKTNWQKVSARILSEHKTQVKQTAVEIREIITQIMAAEPPRTAQSLPIHQNWNFDELLTEQ